MTHTDGDAAIMSAYKHASDVIGLFLEYRDKHGYDEARAREAAAWEAEEASRADSDALPPESLKESSNLAIVAWIGEDHQGSGRTVIMQAITAEGEICLAAMEYDQGKLEALRPLVNVRARFFGKPMRLVRFKFDRIVEETEA